MTLLKNKLKTEIWQPHNTSLTDVARQVYPSFKFLKLHSVEYLLDNGTESHSNTSQHSSTVRWSLEQSEELKRRSKIPELPSLFFQTSIETFKKKKVLIPNIVCRNVLIPATNSKVWITFAFSSHYHTSHYLGAQSLCDGLKEINIIKFIVTYISASHLRYKSSRDQNSRSKHHHKVLETKQDCFSCIWKSSTSISIGQIFIISSINW